MIDLLVIKKLKKYMCLVIILYVLVIIFNYIVKKFTIEIFFISTCRKHLYNKIHYL